MARPDVATAFLSAFNASANREQARALRAATLAPTIRSEIDKIDQEISKGFATPQLLQQRQAAVEQLNALAGEGGPGIIDKAAGGLFKGLKNLGGGAIGAVGGAVNPELSARQGFAAGFNSKDSISPLDTFNLIPGETQGQVQQPTQSNVPSIQGGSELVNQGATGPGRPTRLQQIQKLLPEGYYESLDLVSQQNLITRVSNNASFVNTIKNKLKKPGNRAQAFDIILNGESRSQIQDKLNTLIKETRINDKQRNDINAVNVGSRLIKELRFLVNKDPSSLGIGKGFVGGIADKVGKVPRSLATRNQAEKRVAQFMAALRKAITDPGTRLEGLEEKSVTAFFKDLLQTGDIELFNQKLDDFEQNFKNNSKGLVEVFENVEGADINLDPEIDRKALRKNTKGNVGTKPQANKATLSEIEQELKRRGIQL